ncbi:MAG TPA: elongation factor P maturation arginine rhamnosyltransferase EarP [Alphaproteobacteria bacterium]|nr:elongation factor P maturation arginine rhamnosyltransferase EarP [Alphaproteobacteria bacterium]HOO50233.1 elongation factor P maturation arginine rhamnosyltransferase EarP [Alphaproteobacteria bacterium]
MDFPRSVDIFCRVIDNFGDIGVCWRLARQLSHEYHLSVRLFLDDCDALKQIVPDAFDRSIPDLHIVLWDDALSYGAAADIVIEGFACELPDSVIQAMVVRRKAGVGRPSVWVDLEYLTAEDWALGCHGLSSPHPSNGLKRTMFFPGFSKDSGGVIIENTLLRERNNFQRDVSSQNQWRTAYKLPQFDTNFIDVSLFCYEAAPVSQLFEAFRRSKRPVRVFLPCLGGFGVEKSNNLEVYRIPFFSQDQYDRFLWSCDINFVRGEDSFVRAQLAGRPMIWNIYVQEQQAHLLKLEAFLKQYCAVFSPKVREGLAQSFVLWNQEGQTNGEGWCDLLDHLDLLKQGAQCWSQQLFDDGGLADRLLLYCKNL